MAKKISEVLIYEDIGETPLFGGISPKAFVDQIRGLGDVDVINLRINSAGGNVFDAMAMLNYLQSHRAQVNTYVDGLAASSASLLVFAGERREIAANGMVMIHNPWSMVLGDAQEMRKAADSLDLVRDQIIKTYGRTGLKRAQLTDMMDAETWLPAEQAHDLGFVDTINDPVEIAAANVERFHYRNAPRQRTARPDKLLQIAAAVNRRVPKAVQAKWNQRQ